MAGRSTGHGRRSSPRRPAPCPAPQGNDHRAGIAAATTLWLGAHIHSATAFQIGWRLLALGAAVAAICGTLLTGSYYLAPAVPPCPSGKSRLTPQAPQGV